MEYLDVHDRILFDPSYVEQGRLVTITILEIGKEIDLLHCQLWNHSMRQLSAWASSDGLFFSRNLELPEQIYSLEWHEDAGDNDRKDLQPFWRQLEPILLSKPQIHHILWPAPSQYAGSQSVPRDLIIIEGPEASVNHELFRPIVEFGMMTTEVVTCHPPKPNEVLNSYQCGITSGTLSHGHRTATIILDWMTAVHRSQCVDSESSSPDIAIGHAIANEYEVKIASPFRTLREKDISVQRYLIILQEWTLPVQVKQQPRQCCVVL